MVLVLMGVSGTGKTTVDKVLATNLSLEFVEGDDHLIANVEKMRAWIPLTDEERYPWVHALQQRIEEAFEQGENGVIAYAATCLAGLKTANQTWPREETHPCHINRSRAIA